MRSINISLFPENSNAFYFNYYLMIAFNLRPESIKRKHKCRKHVYDEGENEITTISANHHGRSGEFSKTDQNI